MNNLYFSSLILIETGDTESLDNIVLCFVCSNSKSTSGDAVYALSWTCIILKEVMAPQSNISDDSIQQLVRFPKK